MVETILSALYAPIMMLVQTQHVIEILTGRDSGWNAQRRHAHMTTWSEAWNFHWLHLVIGIVIGRDRVPDLTDVARLADADARRPAARRAAVEDQRQRASSVGFFGWFRMLRTPEEKHVPAVIRRRDELLAHAAGSPRRAALHRAQSPGALCARNRQFAAPAGIARPS